VRRQIDFALADHVARHRGRDFSRGERGKRDRRGDKAPPGKGKKPERSNRGGGRPKRKGRR
jgi:hypothetical protein